jgi:alanyl-tRNA synthetase
VERGQLHAVERLVNAWIRANTAVETSLMGLSDALASGAVALFGEKYAEQVRVLRMGEFSTELCGGTHVSRTGDIGVFKITAETGVAAGIRRVEALTGERAVAWIEALEQRLASIADSVKGSLDSADDKVQQLIERQRKLEKELEQLRGKLASAAGSDLAARAKRVGDVSVLAERVDGADPKVLRDTVDQLKNKLGSAVVVLAAVQERRVSVVAGVTGDRTPQIKAVDLVNWVAQQIGGKGGGRPDMAQGGGTEPERLPEVLQAVAEWVRERL